MNIEASAHNVYRLEIEHRNPLQVEILKSMFDKLGLTDSIEQALWAANNGKKISDIIDAPENESIRALAREGKYTEACDATLALME